MGTFKIEFKTDTVAFEDYPEEEISQRLQHVIEQLHEGRDEGAVLDTNGRPVGNWTYTKEDN